MLLPSDVARLVLGYLQEEGLSATSQAFIHESPNLKEYAEHTLGDGAVPACVFSVFGAGLTTILNEYVAARAKESCHEVPAVMTSLWKKLDFTLKQIKSLQNSPATSACQRARSRVGVANLARQRVLTVASGGSVVCSTMSETSTVISPAHSVFSHSTPVSYTAPDIRADGGSGTPQQAQDGSRSLNMLKETPGQTVVSDRVNPGQMSPGRRKWDTPRKRSGAVSASSGTGRSTTSVSNLTAEQQPEEVVDENFPQLVIQNARDKILGDRLLQEKLAENINKILANEPVPQASKAPSSAIEADQSIDEILGLQGEIHMSDDAIHDILKQTESDPAFQALFELFDCSATIQEANVSDALTTVKMRTVQERKTRKSAAPTLLKKTIISSNGRTSRIENSSARLLVSREERHGVSSAAVGPSGKQKASPFNNSVDVTPMDIDELLETPPLSSSSQEVLDSVPRERTPTSAALCKSTSVSPSRAVAAPDTAEAASNLNMQKDDQQANGSKEQSAATTSLAQCNQPACLSPVQAEVSPMPTSDSGGEAQPASTTSVTPANTTAVAGGATPSTAAPDVAPVGSLTSLSTSAAQTATADSPSLSSPLVPITVAPRPTSAIPNSPGKAASDNSSIVSLKIIISDNQDEDSSSGATVNQAVSNISMDKIPTIYLTSPSKSSGVPGTPTAQMDEAALAVSDLQSSEALASPFSGKAQQSYIIQLPMDATVAGLPGATTSYFLVTEPPTPDVVPARVSKGQPLPSASQSGVTPPHSKGFTSGTAQNLVAKVVQPMSAESTGQQNVPKDPIPSHRRILCFDPSAKAQPTAPPLASDFLQTEKYSLAVPRTAPAILSGNKPKRRVETVRCSADQQTGVRLAKQPKPPQLQQKEAKKNPRKQDLNTHIQESQMPSTSRTDVLQSESSKRSGSGERSKSIDRKHSHEKRGKEAQAKDSCSTQSLYSVSRKDKDEPAEKGPARSREAGAEKTPPPEMPNVMANKENEMKGGSQEQQQPAPASVPRDFNNPPALISPVPNSQKTTANAPSKTTSLAKQAAEMLQDIQGINSPPKSVKRGGVSASDIAAPRTPGTVRNQESVECPRTPSRFSKDGEGTPKHVRLPNTPDVPTCSPASEAGSENSINMAAHTLMILSRAAIARTGSPLKDSLRQEGVREKSPTSSKTAKKRKQTSPTSSPPTKKGTNKSSVKKKDRD
ncbi:protein NPAT-like [Lampetra planeri]